LGKRIHTQCQEKRGEKTGVNGSQTSLVKGAKIKLAWATGEGAGSSHLGVEIKMTSK